MNKLLTSIFILFLTYETFEFIKYGDDIRKDDLISFFSSYSQ